MPVPGATSETSETAAEETLRREAERILLSSAAPDRCAPPHRRRGWYRARLCVPRHRAGPGDASDVLAPADVLDLLASHAARQDGHASQLLALLFNLSHQVDMLEAAEARERSSSAPCLTDPRPESVVEQRDQHDDLGYISQRSMLHRTDRAEPCDPAPPCVWSAIDRPAARPALHRRASPPRRLLRKLAAADARRLPQRESRLLDKPCPGHRGRLGRNLQHRAVALGDRIHDSESLRCDPETATGIGVAPPRKLRSVLSRQ